MKNFIKKLDIKLEHLLATSPTFNILLAVASVAILYFIALVIWALSF